MFCQRALCIAAFAVAMQACAPLATRAPRAAHSSLGCMRAAIASYPLQTRPDAEAHCIAAGLIALHCSVAEAQLASVGKELLDLVGRGDAELRDLGSDRRGINCARSATDNARLILCCEQASRSESDGGSHRPF